MDRYSPPCYTLEETQDLLQLRKSELSHLIRSNVIKAVVYTKAIRDV